MGRRVPGKDQDTERTQRTPREMEKIAVVEELYRLTWERSQRRYWDLVVKPELDRIEGTMGFTRVATRQPLFTYRRKVSSGIWPG